MTSEVENTMTMLDEQAPAPKARVRSLNYLQALNEAMREEMRRDDGVLLLGLDVRANVFGSSGGLFEEFGGKRVRDTPMSEGGFTGAAAGAAMTGLRPVVDYNISSFMYVAMDQLISQVAKARYIFGGQPTMPVVYRSVMMYNAHNAAQHSDRPYPMFMNMPGFKIVAPSTPYDAKGLLKSAIRDQNPVLCFEDANLWTSRGPVPEEEYLVPIGVADIKREGEDVTIVAISGSVPMALAAAETLAQSGISTEVLDPRTLVPLDTDAILRSVAKTGRVVIADPAHRTCGAASEISARVAEQGFESLRAPIARVTAPDVHVPYSPPLEEGMYPTAQRIVAAVEAVSRVDSRGAR